MKGSYRKEGQGHNAHRHQDDPAPASAGRSLCQKTLFARGLVGY